MRPENWPLLLAQWETRARDRTFVWGQWDCCLAVADWVLAVRGVDPAAWFRGRYNDRDGASAAMFAYAGAGLAAVAEKIAAHIPVSAIPILRAQRGDLALMSTPLGPALGVCLGARVAVVGLDGLQTLPLRGALAAWKL